jgi:hypothetical protein
MAQFVFDEAFNEAYDTYTKIAEEEALKADIEDLNEEVSTCSESFISALTLLEDRPGYGNGKGGENKQEGEDKSGGDEDHDHEHGHDDSGKVNHQIDNDLARAMRGVSVNVVNGLTPGELERSQKANGETYTPQPVEFFAGQKISELGFPQNIIEFIKRLLEWISHHVLDIIDKLSNIIRGMLGLSVGPSRFKPDDLKLNLDRARKIETFATVNGTGDYKAPDTIQKVFNSARPIGYTPNTKGPFTTMNVPVQDVSRLFGESTLPKELSYIQEAPGDTDQHTVVVVSVDTSKDLIDLREYMNHFFELFDESFGSNGEQLFTTQDLDIMLHAFNDALRDLLHPENVRPAIIQGQISMDYNSIDPARIRDNMIRTKINTDNLKKAYTQTENQINLIAKIIGDKNIAGVTNMGAQYAYLNLASMNLLIELIHTTDERLKEAVQLQKQLEKMRHQYQQLVDRLNQYRTVSTSITKMSYTSVLQRQVNNLFEAARYAAATVEYRLSALSLYVTELNDIRAVLVNMNAINTQTARVSRFKQMMYKLFHR